jgi:hypothetical protein
MLYRALKKAGVMLTHNASPKPFTPYNIPFDCKNPQEVKADIITLARYEIGVFWSDSCEEYNHFFSDMFKNNHNKCRIMITTTVMEEGIDYPNVNTVFVFAPDDIRFYVNLKLIT